MQMMMIVLFIFLTYVGGIYSINRQEKWCKIGKVAVWQTIEQAIKCQRYQRALLFWCR